MNHVDEQAPEQEQGGPKPGENWIQFFGGENADRTVHVIKLEPNPYRYRYRYQKCVSV